MHQLAVDDGIFQGNFNLADISFLVAVIIFVIAAILAFPRPNTWPYYGILLPLGLAFVAFGLMVI